MILSHESYEYIYIVNNLQIWKIWTGWWLTYPSEKYESQLGLWFPIYGKIKNVPIDYWLVVWTILKNISQWEGLSHILWKIKNVWNHQPVLYEITTFPMNFQTPIQGTGESRSRRQMLREIQGPTDLTALDLLLRWKSWHAGVLPWKMGENHGRMREFTWILLYIYIYERCGFKQEIWI